jgi:hypothetical protein
MHYPTNNMNMKEPEGLFFLLKPYAKQKKREIGAYINILISLL